MQIDPERAKYLDPDFVCQDDFEWATHTGQYAGDTDNTKSEEKTTTTEEQKQNNRIHLSNAIIKLIPGKRELHYMYEDNDLEGREDAEESFVRLDEREPGQHVLIDTGDYFVPPCSADFDAPDARDHYNCETYDAEYYLYLVPASVWEQCKDEVLKADREYRDLMNKCQRQ